MTIVGVSAGSLSTCAGACSGASTATGSVVGVVGTAVTVSAAMAGVAVEASGFAEASAVSATSVSAAGATGVVAVAASASAAVAVGLAKDWADSVTDSSVEDSGSDVGSANSGRPFQTRLYFSMLAFTAVRSRARLDCEDWTATYTNRSLLSTRTR